MPNLMQPYEIIATPFDVYVTTGTDAFPAVGVAPTGGWTLLGRSGTGGQNQKEGGVTVQHNQTFLTIRTEGHTGPFKVTRLTEDEMFTFTLFDLDYRTYQHIFQADEVTLSATTVGMGVSRGPDVREVKVLVQGASPMGYNKKAQYEVPRAYQSGSTSLSLSKTAPAGLNFEFTALEDTAAATTGLRFGRVIMQL